MSTITAQRVRMKVDPMHRGQLLDVRSGEPAFFFVGNPLQFELAVFYEDVLQEVTNFSSVTVEIKAMPPQDAPPPQKTEVAQMAQTETTLNNTLTLPDWEAGTDQHVIVSFDRNQSAIAPGRKWIGVYAVTNDPQADPITLAADEIWALQPGAPSEGVPPGVDGFPYVFRAGDRMTGLLGFNGTDHGGLELLSLTQGQIDLLSPTGPWMLHNSSTDEVISYLGGQWVSLGSGGAMGVDSFNGRTGPVVSVDADYNAGQIVNTPSGAVTSNRLQGAVDELEVGQRATQIESKYEGQPDTNKFTNQNLIDLAALTALLNISPYSILLNPGAVSSDPIGQTIGSLQNIANPLPGSKLLVESDLGVLGGTDSLFNVLSTDDTGGGLARLEVANGNPVVLRVVNASSETSINIVGFDGGSLLINGVLALSASNIATVTQKIISHTNNTIRDAPYTYSYPMAGAIADGVYTIFHKWVGLKTRLENLAVICGAGSATISIRFNGISITGMNNMSVTTTNLDATSTENNTISPGHSWQVEVTGGSGLQNVLFAFAGKSNVL